MGSVEYPTVEKVTLKLDMDGDHIKVNIHLQQNLMHTVHDSSGEVKLLDPVISPCVMKGGIRHKHVVPHFRDKGRWVISPEHFDDIMTSVKNYDGLNGKITPNLHKWTDAFCDPEVTIDNVQPTGPFWTVHLNIIGGKQMYMVSLLLKMTCY